MAKRRFRSPLPQIASAPTQMDTFGNMRKKSDGYYFSINATPKGGTTAVYKDVKGASNDFRLTDQGVAYICKAQFVGSVCHTMIAIALAESGGDAVIIGGPNNNGTWDYGLFQINSMHNLQTAWWDPRVSTRKAFELYTEARARLGGDADAALKEQWSSYKSKAVNLYAPRATAALAAIGGPLDNGAVVEQPLLGVIDDISDPDNPDGIAGGINDAVGGMLKGLAPVAYIAGGAIILLLGVVLIMKAQGKK